MSAQTDGGCCWSAHRRAAAGACAQPRDSLAQPGSPAPSPCHHHSPGGRGDPRAFPWGAAAPGRQGAAAGSTASPSAPRQQVPSADWPSASGESRDWSPCPHPGLPSRSRGWSPSRTKQPIRKECATAGLGNSQSACAAPPQVPPSPRDRENELGGGSGERWAGSGGCAANRERGREECPVPVRSRFDPGPVPV